MCWFFVSHFIFPHCCCITERFGYGCAVIQVNIGRVYVSICHQVARQLIITLWRGKFLLDKRMEPYRNTHYRAIATVWQWFEIIWRIRHAWLVFFSHQRMPGFCLAEKTNYSHFTAPTPRVDSAVTHLNRCALHFSILFERIKKNDQDNNDDNNSRNATKITHNSYSQLTLINALFIRLIHTIQLSIK